MLRKLLCILLLFLSFAVAAQKASLKGSLSDSVNFKFMGYSGVSLILIRDSTLHAHQWTKDDGSFEFNNIVPDTYLFRATRPTFADYEDILFLKPGDTRDLGNISMVSKANLLREVIVRGKRDAITLKGDTVEYLVDSFLVNKQSTVEDLLKKLPGIQVDKNGKITAQGQTVQKVLVDGEEFFGDDPTVATRNLKATNIDKVQVFDKKSEQAAFSGIDDGEKTKTINLTLKENAKKGYFGKADAAAGTQQRYENEAMLNSFSKKRKFSVYGAATNTNKTSLSWEDAEKYSGGRGNVEYDESGYMYSFNNSDEGDFNGTGIPQTWYIGTYYSNKFNKDKQSINGTVSHKEMQVNGYDNNLTQYILPDTTYSNRQNNIFNNQRMQNTANGTWEMNIDSLTTVKLKINAVSGTSDAASRFTSESLNGDAKLVNSNNRSNTTHSDFLSLNNSLSLSRKFHKKGRTLFAQVNHIYKSTNSDGLLESDTYFYDSAGAVNSSSVIDQKKTSAMFINTVSGNATYTEPLSKKLFLVSDAEIRKTWNDAGRFSFTKNSNGEYANVVDSLSSSYRYNILTSKGGLALKYVYKKLTTSLGGKISYTSLDQEDKNSGAQQSRYYLNLFPSAMLQYKIKSTSQLQINYSGSTRQPSLQQVQPLQDNTNPLVIYKGNSALSQSFTNSFSVRYNSYKPLTGRSLFASGSCSFTNNDFTSFDQVDSKGRKTYQTVNINGNYNMNGFVYYSFELAKTGIQVGNQLNGNFSRNHNFINSLANENKNIGAGYELSLYMEEEKKYGFELSGELDYNQSKTSLRPDLPTKYWIQTYSAAAEIFLPFKFSIEGEADVNIRQRTSAFDRNLNTVIVNLNLKKRLLKNENMEISLRANDVLNQNIGFYRTATSNFVNENTHTVLKRYFLLGVVWNFTKNKAAAAPAAETP